MTPDVSAIIVSHRSAEEAAACAASLRREFERERISGEIVLVDCGSGRREEGTLRRAAADTLVLLSDNRGYSGGVNAGLARARGPLLILCNADVLFCPGSLGPLVATASRPRVGAVGPLCTWDPPGRVYMPPGFAPGFIRDFFQLSAGRFPRVDEHRFGEFARATLSLWREGGTVDNLTGAVLASRREAFDRAGRFDERFPFEYEETEWEERLRAVGFELRYEPRARVRHLYARSAKRSAQSAVDRAASRRLYIRRRYGRIGSRLLGLAPRLARPVSAETLEVPIVPRRPGAWLAISPNPSLLPFAGTPLEEDFSLGVEMRSSLAAGSLYLRVFDGADGRSLRTYVWENIS